ncbi:glutathione S-transferase N-terminal domain-containing protein [Altererythrobacter arenosus]|uniref:Glutathione S-transferase N-terminal domain-containing protein n=1 Tax=Altererythrobacter arenosus TaxID=3032592 RepID=A0ABY8FUF2_9SPHN|nr:glutathione S-transferase N-terminal domain-containing protein [Altererythrobacter sp. CAU 1644]WFL78452.1 glutathione S-transferase N-terminal domain-containing protein [Altererythrobacter sp. CAU 1644]
MWKVYGSSVSYYTGKLEAYLRYKGIAYEALPTPYGEARMLIEKVGAVQMPIVERDDGRWMSDTTPILLQVEQEHPTPSILPADPVVGFVAALVEDYGDEWLWRPAMHYRWSYRRDRRFISDHLAEEVGGFIRAPHWLKRMRIAKRQFTNFVVKDGVNEATRAHADKAYLNALDAMSAMLANRPFLLGNAPSLADYGMMGPMFRHFGQDPTPAEIMRQRAPLVFEWVARMWCAAQVDEPQFLSEVPPDAAALLREACETHLVQLAANAAAFGRDETHFGVTIQGCRYEKLPASRYRVWCLEELRRAFAALDADAQGKVRALLSYDGAEILWSGDIPPPRFNEDHHLPFGKAINVYGEGTPP